MASIAKKIENSESEEVLYPWGKAELNGKWVILHKKGNPKWAILSRENNSSLAVSCNVMGVKKRKLKLRGAPVPKRTVRKERVKIVK
jgi:hypothetical protein